MRQFVIMTDSSADLPEALIKQYDIDVVQLYVALEGEEPRANNEVDVKALYDALRAKRGSKTAAANSAFFEERMEAHLSAGRDVLYLGFSSGLSGTYQASCIAATELREKYPDRKLYTVDTLCAALGQGLLVYLAAQKAEEGADIDAVRDYTEALKPHLTHLFTVNDLFFLKRGGRDRPDQTVFIGHGDCLADAEYLAGKIKEATGLDVKVIDYVGPVIGSHAGPGVVALFFLGKER